jgi:hypothetical protein
MRYNAAVKRLLRIAINAATANAQHAWLKTFLELHHGIPCEDTFGRVFARIDPAGFEACFIRWTRDLAAATEGRLVPIDGKSDY